MKCEMSAKASPPTSVVKIKKEIASDEIKDFAETAMNELLGWYGYDSVDRLDLSSKSSRLANSTNSVDAGSRKEFNGSRTNHRDDSTTSDRESSREDSKSPSSTKLSEKQERNCGWCRRIVPENSPDFLTTPDGPRYCSESCFAQSRRASFKRAKTCDWCRHVRHAVSYVDFQDGASQLQFCSDKCLNQYKMQIFCRETQAHLDMNPHLKEKGAEASGALITPELWLKNCRSRSASPVSELSRSSTPTQGTSAPGQKMAHKPIISVAPVSKLMSKGMSSTNMRQSPKHSRKKRTVRPPINQNSSTNSGIGNNVNSHNSKGKILVNTLTSPPGAPKPCTFTNVQDLRLNVQQISPMDGTHAPRPSLPPSFFSPNPNAFPLRPPFMPNPLHPRLVGLPPPQQIPSLVPDLSGMSSFLGATPPVTVMVPYPIIVPLPIPIPIPLPITEFMKAAAAKTPKDVVESSDVEKSTASKNPNSAMEQSEPPLEEPLDFTKSKTVEVLPKTSESFNDSHSPEQPPAQEENNEEDDGTEKQKLPKFKITRLHTKRLITKESENSRPLRKRKRVIDCDYVRSSKEEEDSSKQKAK